jgi:hypothetical protein
VTSDSFWRLFYACLPLPVLCGGGEEEGGGGEEEVLEEVSDEYVVWRRRVMILEYLPSFTTSHLWRGFVAWLYG